MRCVVTCHFVDSNNVYGMIGSKLLQNWPYISFIKAPTGKPRMGVLSTLMTFVTTASSSCVVFFILITSFIKVSTGTTCAGSNCPKLKDCNATDWADFTVESYTEEWTNIYCCMDSSASSLSWWKHADDGSWLPYDKFAGSSTSIEQTDSNQVLNFYRPASYQNGRYRCQAKMPDGSLVKHDFSIIFHANLCKSLADYPMIQNPINNGTSPFCMMPHKSISLPCEVDFGYCPTQSSPLVMNITWMYEDLLPDGTTQLRVISNGTKYQISEKRTIDAVASLMTIANIKDNDYKKYYCRAADGRRTKLRLIDFQKGLEGTCAQPHTLIIYELAFQICLAVVLVMILITGLVMPIMWKYRLDILLWRHSYLKEKSGDFEYTYDAILVHAGTNPMHYAGMDPPLLDYEFVKDVLFEQLTEEFKYKVFMPLQDLPAIGDTEIEFINEMEKSRRIIFILSEQFLQEGLCAAVFSHSMRQEDRASNRNIYILNGDIPDSLWDSDTNKAFGNLEPLKACIRNARKSWLKVGKTLDWTGSYTLAKCAVVREASDQKSSKQIEQFWKKLCLALPPKSDVRTFRFRPKLSDTSSGSSSRSDGSLLKNDEYARSSGMV